MSGGDGDDSMDGGTGADLMSGGNGADSMNGGDQADNMTGDAGNDTMDGGDDVDVVDGGADNDVLTGGTGADTLIGGTGNDTMSEATDGAIDLFRGGAGNDTMTGGGGERDNFEFTLAGAANADLVTNFELGTDRILLPRSWTGESVGPSPITGTWWKVLTSAPSNSLLDADDRLVYDQTSSKLYYDQDGSGTAFQPQEIVELAGVLAGITQATNLSTVFEFIPG